MGKIITVILLIQVFIAFAQSEERIISGKLKDASGAPLPGVNITIKGSNVGTTTNANGEYSIKVPLGATLIFSFVGMTTREVVVTEHNSVMKSAKSERRSNKNTKSNSKAQAKEKDSAIRKDTIGMASLSDNTPTFLTDRESLKQVQYSTSTGRRQQAAVYPDIIRKIQFINHQRARQKYGTYGRNGVYLVTHDNTWYRRYPSFTLSTYVGIETINKMPSPQRTFSQGEQNQWHGADQQQVFSWGPPIKSLEYDGADYPYDVNGKLVMLGQGNGVPAQYYNPATFFRNGIRGGTLLDIDIPFSYNNRSAVLISGGRQVERGVIPNSNLEKYSISARAKRIQIHDQVTADGSIAYESSSGQLLSRGSNLATIFGSVLRTPPTFDNTNGLTSSEAVNDSKANVLSNGTQRSYAPGYADNPYWLINNLPDRESFRHFTSHAKMQYHAIDNLNITMSGSYEKQWSDLINGMPVGSASWPEGRLTNRNEIGSVLTTFFSPDYRLYAGGSQFNFSSSWHYTDYQRHMEREDGFGFGEDYVITSADILYQLERRLNRATHEIVNNVEYKWSGLTLKALTRHYFSNTLLSSSYNNIFPTVGAQLNFMEFIRTNAGFLTTLSLFGNYITVLQEAPLVYGKWNYASLMTMPDQYQSIFESQEIFFEEGLLPEDMEKIEVGVKLSFFNGRVNLVYNYFNNVTNNYIVPVYRGDAFVLDNVASIRSRGHEITISYSNYRSNTRWGAEWIFGATRPMVEEVYSGDAVPLSGFSNVQTVLAKGQPIGAIYGSSWRRDEQGQPIIGKDGFPLVDESMKMIGNPNPDWTMSFRGHMSWKGFTGSFLVETRYGQDMWNGTGQALNYSGMSKETERDRLISGYLFEGVTEEGSPNTVFVDFADPEKPTNENRWVRYGFSGVGEEGIENASWIRLQEVRLSYRFRKSNARNIGVEIALAGRNLLLITPYSGVDPLSSLFNYSTASGLDLFNSPATRSYQAQLTLKF